MSGKRTMPPGVAAVIPSFEPNDFLVTTVLGLSECGTEHIIVVNDGSDRTYDFFFDRLCEIPQCTIISHPKNLGKGAALRTGMKYCLNNIKDCRAVVTVDGDGHHRISDVVACAHKAVDKNEIILGMREATDPTILKRGHYGNLITSRLIGLVCNFDFKVTDPLTGLRGIPSRYLTDIIDVSGDAYDFETNMILEISKAQIPMRTFSIVGFHYNDGKSHSHFRPFRDSLRVILEVLRFYDKQFAYLFSSLLCYAFEYIVYRLFLSNMPWLTVGLINYLSRGISYGLNFFINKKFVFKIKHDTVKTAIKYFVSVFFAITLSTVLIVWLNSIFPSDGNTMAKYIKPPVDTIVFFINYYIQKKWVFKEKVTVFKIKKL